MKIYIYIYDCIRTTVVVVVGSPTHLKKYAQVKLDLETPSRGENKHI